MSSSQPNPNRGLSHRAHSPLQLDLQSRRSFIRTLSLAPAALNAWAADPPRLTRFGLITDIHQDIIPDAEARVNAFNADIAKRKADFVLQCGDFCIPKAENQSFLKAWNAIPCRRYHVLGNHDMEGGLNKEITTAFYGMSRPFYTFEEGPIRGIVLDGNDPGGTSKGYARYIGKEQQQWLAAELENEAKPALLFVHQPLDDAGGIENAAEIEALLRTALAKRPGCVVAIFSGHLHRDYVRSVAGIPSIQINSASYVWLGSKYQASSYPPEMHQARPNLDKVAPFREPLWCFVTLDTGKGELKIEGRSSAWLGPDPWARGTPESMCNHTDCHPQITNRLLRLS